MLLSCSLITLLTHQRETRSPTSPKCSPHWSNTQGSSLGTPSLTKYCRKMSLHVMSTKRPAQRSALVNPGLFQGTSDIVPSTVLRFALSYQWPFTANLTKTEEFSVCYQTCGSVWTSVTSGECKKPRIHQHLTRLCSGVTSVDEKTAHVFDSTHWSAMEQSIQRLYSA